MFQPLFREGLKHIVDKEPKSSSGLAKWGAEHVGIEYTKKLLDKPEASSFLV